MMTLMDIADQLHRIAISLERLPGIMIGVAFMVISAALIIRSGLNKIAEAIREKL